MPRPLQDQDSQPEGQNLMRWTIGGIIIVLIILCILFSSCSNKFVTADIYSTPIEYANYNEPPILYWWVIDDGMYFFYATNSNPKSKPDDLQWFKSEDMPKEIITFGKTALRDVAVKSRLLNGL